MPTVGGMSDLGSSYSHERHRAVRGVNRIRPRVQGVYGRPLIWGVAEVAELIMEDGLPRNYKAKLRFRGVHVGQG